MRRSSTALPACAALSLFACAEAPPPSTGPEVEPSQAIVGATSPPAPSATPVDADALFRAPSTIDFSKNPDLVGRIAESPHRYFRFINAQFSSAICARLAADLPSMKPVALHGDAHLEQYAVSDLGRGLTDFDDSSRGPAAIDLVRFEASIRLAVRQIGWDAEEEAVVKRFLDGYRAGLADPDLEAPAPALVARFKGDFTQDRDPFLKYADSVMEPFESDPAVDKKKFDDTFTHYVDLMQKERKDLPKGFFTLKRAGLLRVGIGSALDKKFLLRLDGPTAKPSDDIILEVKEVKTLSEISCVKKNLPNRSLELRDPSPDTYRPEYDLGYVFLPGADYWVHEWSANFKEIKVAKSFKSPSELSEVAYDAGVQLGRGHALGEPPDSLDEAEGAVAKHALAQGKAQLAMLSQHEKRFSDLSKDLATETVTAWERFKQEAERSGLLRASAPVAP